MHSFVYSVLTENQALPCKSPQNLSHNSEFMCLRKKTNCLVENGDKSNGPISNVDYCHCLKSNGFGVGGVSQIIR